jgi:dephospho-CoA kinase
MIVVGLTGSIAMGKSTAARMFASLGVPVFDSDAEVHRQYATGGDAAKEIAALYPEAIAGGAVDRQALSRLVLGNPHALKQLEAIVHPIVRKHQCEFLQRCRQQQCQIAVLDIPLLFETHREKEVDRIVVVTATSELQRRRALVRPGMSDDKLDKILSRQMPDAEKRAKADFVVDTSQSLDHTLAQIRDIVASLHRQAEAAGQ